MRRIWIFFLLEEHYRKKKTKLKNIENQIKPPKNDFLKIEPTPRQIK